MKTSKNPKPERRFRIATTHDIQQSSQQNQNHVDHSNICELSKSDPYEFIDPVKVLDRIPDKFEELVISNNWKERKGALDCLLSILKVPKIENAQYSSLVGILSKVPFAYLHSNVFRELLILILLLLYVLQIVWKRCRPDYVHRFQFIDMKPCQQYLNDAKKKSRTSLIIFEKLLIPCFVMSQQWIMLLSLLKSI